jgi:hypothetical protein
VTTNYKKIAGNPHTSVCGVLMYASIWFGMLTILFTLDLYTALITLFGVILFLLFGTWHLHYFIITENNLIVKNHLSSSVNVVYNLKEIDNVTFTLVKRRRLSGALRIKKRNFYAASLEQEHWDELKKIFTELNIPVTDKTKEPFL